MRSIAFTDSAMRASTSGRTMVGTRAAATSGRVNIARHVYSPRRPTSSSVAVHAQDEGRQRGGPTGLNVAGARPTSPKGWNLMMQALKDAKVKLVSSQELVFSQDQGQLIIDIRPEAEFAKGHIPGAANVPFYQPIQGWTPWQAARRVAFAAFGILNGTEVNPYFEEQAGELIQGGKPVTLYCSMGGHLDPISFGPASIPSGQEGAAVGKKLQTRSMVAAYQLLQAGHSNISILKGGYTEWANSGRDVAVLVEE